MTLAPVPLSCAVNVLLLIAARRLPGIFHVSGDRDVSYEAAARAGAAAMGADPRLVMPVRAAQSAVDSEPLPLHTTLDIGAIKATLGLVPPDVQWTIETACWAGAEKIPAFGCLTRFFRTVERAVCLI
jgi:dTDP-4-dehydrorhamnose reductase